MSSDTSSVVRVMENQWALYRRFWRSPVTFFVVVPTLFLSAMGVGVGGLIEQRTQLVGGVPYLDFVAAGLIAASAMQAAAGESLWPVMGGLQWVRTFHAIVATPAEPRDVYAGLILWDAVRAAIGASVFLLVATAFGAVESVTGVLAVPAAMLTAGSVAAPLTAFAATQETDLRFPIIMRLGVIPLFLFSGTFFPISQLPRALQIGAWVSPLYHGVELARRATTGHVSAGPMLVHALVLAAFIAVGTAWGFRSFTKRLKP